MIKNRIRHWSCSRFADYVRGTTKPYFLKWDEWEKWHKEIKLKNPWRYWLAEDILPAVQDIIYFPIDIYDTIKSYIRNRFVDKLHFLKTGLKPGEYYDFDKRIIHGLFNELKDIVEVEYAYLMKMSKKDGHNNYKFKNGRCPLAGLDYLNWSISLVYNEEFGCFPDHALYNLPTEQSKVATQTLELYNWWKNRKDRPDLYKLFSEKKNGENYYKLITEQEELYYKEDTDMIVKLINLRKSLWV